MEWLLLFAGVVVGYLVGRWRRAWVEKLTRGENTTLTRLRSVEAELETMRARRRGAREGSDTEEEAVSPEPEPTDSTGPEMPAPIHEVMTGSDDGVVLQGEETRDATDDLTELRGIGPKTAEHLTAAGVRTYSDLAALTPDDIRHILAGARLGVSSADAESWPAQATLAAEGRWLALRALQAATQTREQ